MHLYTHASSMYVEFLVIICWSRNVYHLQCVVCFMFRFLNFQWGESFFLHWLINMSCRWWHTLVVYPLASVYVPQLGKLCSNKIMFYIITVFFLTIIWWNSWFLKLNKIISFKNYLISAIQQLLPWRKIKIIFILNILFIRYLRICLINSLWY